MSHDTLAQAVEPDVVRPRRPRRIAVAVGAVVALLLVGTGVARVAGDRAQDQSARSHHGQLADTVANTLNAEAARQLITPVAERSSEVLLATARLAWPDPSGPSSQATLVRWDTDRIAVTTTVVSDDFTTTEMVVVSQVRPTDQSVLRCVVASDVLTPNCPADVLALLR